MSDGTSGNPPNDKQPSSNVANGNGAGGYVAPTIARGIWETPESNERTAESGGNANQSSGPTAEIKRGRGRPKGSGTKQSAQTGKTEAAISVSLSSLEKLLVTIHATVALGVGRMEIQLDDNEARELAKALLEVQAQYKIVLDPRTAAWMNLAMVAAPIYGSRAVAIWMERLRDEPQAPATAEATAAQPPAKETAQPKSNAVIDMAGFKFDPANIKLHS